jgi:hypothetical protein
MASYRIAYRPVALERRPTILADHISIGWAAGPCECGLSHGPASPRHSYPCRAGALCPKATSHPASEAGVSLAGGT